MQCDITGNSYLMKLLTLCACSSDQPVGGRERGKGIYRKNPEFDYGSAYKAKVSFHSTQHMATRTPPPIPCRRQEEM